MELVERMLDGDRMALARAITMVENGSESLPEIMDAVHDKGIGSRKIGVTGPPGAGKSTLVDIMIAKLRERKDTKVAAVLVDPSSPFTGGAILGDRIRMQKHALDPGVFIRSLSSRGSHGGLSLHTRQVVQLMAAYGAEYIIIETVGVGQTELDIMEVADTTVVTLVPEAGDAVQALKAGLMEIADIFAVNKADRDGADGFAAELKAMLSLKEKSEADWIPPVLKTVATKAEGVDELLTQISSHRKYLEDTDTLDTKQRKMRRIELIEILMSETKSSIMAEEASGGEVADYFEKVMDGSMSPYAAADHILSNKLKKNSKRKE